MSQCAHNILAPWTGPKEGAGPNVSGEPGRKSGGLAYVGGDRLLLSLITAGPDSSVEGGLRRVSAGPKPST